MLLVTDVAVACASCCVHASPVSAIGTMALSTLNRALYRPICLFTKHGNSLCLHELIEVSTDTFAFSHSMATAYACMACRRALFNHICLFTKHVNSLCLHGMQVWVVPFAALNADTGAPQVNLFIKSWCSS